VDFDEYQSVSKATQVYPNEAKIIYPVLGLVGEAGEVANKVKKLLRGDHELTQEIKAAIADEMGDQLWYLAALASDLELNLEEIARANIDKLADRRDRGVIRGSGDNR